MRLFKVGADISRERAVFLGILGLLVATAWLVLWLAGSLPHAVRLHDHAFSDADTPAFPFALLFTGSWTVMTVAMMLPTSLPVIATFYTLASMRRDRFVLVALVIGGYLATWILFGTAVYGGTLALHRLAAASPSLTEHSRAFGGVMLLVAGAYQFSSLKYRCLEKCRSPLSFVIEHWQGRHDRRQAFRLGVHHGLFCVGCCWALMLLMFGVGVGALAWMVILAAVMAVEKNVAWGRRLSTPLGVALLVCGAGLLANG
jgi:predicted metal-binding membrane protein